MPLTDIHGYPGITIEMVNIFGALAKMRGLTLGSGYTKKWRARTRKYFQHHLKMGLKPLATRKYSQVLLKPLHVVL